MVSINLNFSNKTFYTLIAIISILIISGIAYAYKTNQQPSVFGHSAEELEVNVSGTITTLQQAINSGSLGGGSGGGSLVCTEENFNSYTGTGDSYCATKGATCISILYSGEASLAEDCPYSFTSGVGTSRTVRCCKITGSGGSSSPDYDSGWFAVDSTLSNEITKAHGFGSVPINTVLWACGGISNGEPTTRIVTTTGRPHRDHTIDYLNPSEISADSANIYVGLAGGRNAWSVWDPIRGWTYDGDEDANYKTAYYRILAWK